LTRGIFLLYLAYRGLSASEIAVYSIMLNAMTALCEVPTGILGDKIGTRNSVMSGCILLALHAVIMANTRNHIILIVMGGMEGIAYTFVSGSDSALLYEILEERDEQKDYLSINSKLLALQSVTMGIMIFAGGVLARYSWELVYYIQASAMFTAMLMLSKITNQRKADSARKADPIRKADAAGNEGYRQKSADRWKSFIKYNPRIVFVIFVLGFSICDGVFCGYYNMNQLVFSKVGISIAVIGTFFSASYFINSAAYILVDFILRKINRKQIFIYGLLVQSVILFILVFVTDKGVFLVISIIACFIPEIIFAVADSIVQDYIISEYRATMLSIVSMVRTGVTAICYGGMGVMFDRVPVRAFLLGINLLVIGSAVISWGFYFRMKKLLSRM
ncbi:MAG: MFS transporter, partial [Lachnospiraceae bacterium]|nr:MFS transporter [Lachnospiraceae bacterium]